MRFFKGIVPFFVLAMSLFISCTSTSPETKKPDPLVERDSMIEWTAESYIIEGEIFYSTNEEEKQALTQALYADFFARHHITEEIFKKNSEYYLSDKEKSQEFMETVMQRIRDQRDAIQKEE